MGQAVWVGRSLGLLLSAQQQSPGPLAEPLVRGWPILDHLLLVPLTTPNTTWAGLPWTAPTPSQPSQGCRVTQLRLTKSTRELLDLASSIFLASSAMVGVL